MSGDGPTRRRRGGSRLRQVLLFSVVVVGVGALLALITGARPPALPLDPDDPGPTGGLALVEVLRQHGVDVHVIRSIDQLPILSGSVTLVLGDPRYLGDSAAQRFRGAARDGVRVVLLRPTATAMSELGYPIIVLPGGSGDAVAAECTTSAAAGTDSVQPTTMRLVGPAGATGCFPYTPPTGGGDGAAGYGMVTIPSTDAQPQVVAVAFGGAMSNSQILAADNAGVAVRLLGSNQHLYWYQPDVADLGESASTVQDPWPAWRWPAVWVLGLAFVLFAIAIGRRLGRLVPEPLPVVVKAAETTEARARLYQRTHDRGRAATILRHGSIARLRRRLGVDAPPGPVTIDPVLVDRVADVTGLPAAEVAARLMGPLPDTDADLVRLSQQLADLEEKVTHP